jgi:hypothetical protein
MEAKARVPTELQFDVEASCFLSFPLKFKVLLTKKCTVEIIYKSIIAWACQFSFKCQVMFMFLQSSLREGHGMKKNGTEMSEKEAM